MVENARDCDLQSQSCFSIEYVLITYESLLSSSYYPLVTNHNRDSFLIILTFDFNCTFF